MEPGPAIETRALSRAFGATVAVERLNLAVAPGELFGLLGSNGAGKSTTLKMLTTLLSPSSGEAFVAGFEVRSRPRAVRRRIGYVPQLLSADAALTGRENLLLFARLYGVPRAARRERVQTALRFMNLEAAGDRLVRTYSGGMIRALEIAQSMLHRPEVLFLDEPTVGLDPNARHAVWQRLQQLRADAGTTILLTTHDMEEARVLCDRIAIMHRGRVVAEGTPAALEAELGPGATLEQVFIQHTGGIVEEGGGYRDIVTTRELSHRVG